MDERRKMQALYDEQMREYDMGDYREVSRINETRMPILILCDGSISMGGLPINNLNCSVNRFAKDICKDTKAAQCVDVAVVSFNDTPKLEQDWRPVTQMRPLELKASGGTNLSAALNDAVRMLRERGYYYEDMGMEVKMPYLILITDGYGGDVSETAELIRQRTADKKMKLWVLAVKGYDKETVAQLTGGKRVFELVDEEGFDFSEFFDFMAVSIKAVSTRAANERVNIESNIGKEGSNCRVPDLDAWLNED